MDSNIISQPFLRWAGSKRLLLKQISEYIPSNYNDYYEPFVGSGALFFSLLKEGQACHLYDLNERLINTYVQIRDHVEEIIGYLRTYKNNEAYYYYIREKTPSSLIEEASQFLFLNKTCYNGLYRVNSKDEFNVPYGRRVNVDFIAEDLLRISSKCLSGVDIAVCDFEDTLLKIKKNDFVFIDPPYTTTHNANRFIEYNQKIFEWRDQIRLHDYIKALHAKGVYFVLTNAAHHSIRELYSDICSPFELERRSSIGGKNSYRGIIKEYLFTNTR